MFLSDGVFAIAMTLLVLEVRLPDLAATITNDELSTALLELGGRLFAYALSFAVLATFWVGHWRRFRKIERADVRLAWINVLLLGLVAFIPFPTAVIGEFGNLPAAVALYAVTLSLAGLAGTLSWFYAARARLLLPGTPTSLRASGTLRALVLPVVMLGSLLLLPVMGVFVVEWSWLLILPLVVLTRPPRIPGKT